MHLHDMKQRAENWQRKQSRLKQSVITSGLIALAVIVSVLWNLFEGNQIRWLIILLIGTGALVVLLFSLSAYTNTMLVAMYYNACYHFLAAPEDLEMITGTIEDVQKVNMPYIGMLYHVTLRVAGEQVRYYCPGKLLRGLRPHERIRVQTYDLFAIRVETTGNVDPVADSTKPA